jgi:hypothetical protein
MGPDLTAWLKLEDGRMLLLLIQLKVREKGNKYTITSVVTVEAVKSLTPANFFVSLIFAKAT